MCLCIVYRFFPLSHFPFVRQFIPISIYCIWIHVLLIVSFPLLTLPRQLIPISIYSTSFTLISLLLPFFSVHTCSLSINISVIYVLFIVSFPLLTLPRMLIPISIYMPHPIHSSFLFIIPLPYALPSSLVNSFHHFFLRLLPPHYFHSTPLHSTAIRQRVITLPLFLGTVLFHACAVLI